MQTFQLWWAKTVTDDPRWARALLVALLVLLMFQAWEMWAATLP